MDRPVFQKIWRGGGYHIKNTPLSIFPADGGWQIVCGRGSNHSSVAPWFQATGFEDVIFPTLKSVREAIIATDVTLPAMGKTGYEINFVIDGISRSVWSHDNGSYVLRSPPSAKYGDEFVCFKKIPTGYSLYTRRGYFKRALKEKGQYPTLRAAVEAYYERPWELRKRLVSYWSQH